MSGSVIGSSCVAKTEIAALELPEGLVVGDGALLPPVPPLPAALVLPLPLVGVVAELWIGSPM